MFRTAIYKGIIPPIPPIPPNTVRVRTSDGNAPIKVNYTYYEIATLVSGTTDVYDVYKSGTTFHNLLYKSTNVIEVIGANTSNITEMDGMFDGCTALTTVPLFNTSNVVNMNIMFWGCRELNKVPLFDTSSVVDMSYMLYNCLKVESGALALYQQASTQTNPPSSHTDTFTYCGRDTVTGAAELAQIPSSWGGTAT